MSTALVEASYGKSRVRLTKVSRHGDRHELKELSVDIQLQGDFDRSYTDGDNSSIIATDTMKNTVYALAAKHPIDTIENFAIELGQHFLSRNKHVSAASVDIRQDRWERIITGGKPHNHAFVGGNRERRVANVDCLPDSVSVESGIEDLNVLKTTASEFTGFIRDEYTTLPEVRDRIFATSIVAYWTYSRPKAEYDKVYDAARQLMLDVFAQHHSLAVQQTLYEMGNRVLEACADIEEIRISMPNQHRILFDLTRLGLKNENEIFVPIDEPFGLISATMARTASGTREGKNAELAAKR